MRLTPRGHEPGASSLRRTRDDEALAVPCVHGPVRSGWECDDAPLARDVRHAAQHNCDAVQQLWLHGPGLHRKLGDH